MSTLTAFNTQLERLVKDLITYFPESKDFKTSKWRLNKLTFINN